jgi:putative SOS response-associated peptidase YedK
MCGRFTLTTEMIDLVSAMLGISSDETFREGYTPRWNIAPMQPHWVAFAEREERAVEPATWGLVNFWDKDRRAGARQINARSETVAERGAFSNAFQVGRCIVPADGFYEWTGDAKARRPFWFHRPDDEPFAFAGLRVSARLANEPEPTTTFTILTTDANGLVGHIHDRMPVILPDEGAIAAWLHADEPVERLRTLMRPVDDRYLVARSVSPRVNSVRVDDAACIEESEPETQGPLL